MDDYIEDYITPVGPDNDILLSEEDVAFLQSCGISLTGLRREQDGFPVEDV